MGRLYAIGIAGRRDLNRYDKRRGVSTVATIIWLLSIYVPKPPAYVLPSNMSPVTPPRAKKSPGRNEATRTENEDTKGPYTEAGAASAVAPSPAGSVPSASSFARSCSSIQA